MFISAVWYGVRCRQLSEKGSYIWNLNYREWYENPNYDLFFIRVERELAGFVIIRHLVEEDVYYLNHFSVLKKFRRKSIGKEAATQAFNLYKGRWRVSEFDSTMQQFTNR
jgi:predicted acetyltransferase